MEREFGHSVAIKTKRYPIENTEARRKVKEALKKTESNEVRCEGEKRKQDRSERNNEYREEETKKETERQRERKRGRHT